MTKASAPLTAPKVVTVTAWKVACDGAGPGLGHPRVWLAIPHDSGAVECGYCGTTYQIDRAHAHDDH
ncbi:zinc-finger domain-containing protein [Paracoccus sp. p4-l81]|uniref:zinc-finger domain-containing protein n=1 Tax=unclassified Paracoccus (in: a-proteobacteria) TaxID=2688777 RepID=UPI0035B80FA0